MPSVPVSDQVPAGECPMKGKATTSTWMKKMCPYISENDKTTGAAGAATSSAASSSASDIPAHLRDPESQEASESLTHGEGLNPRNMMPEMRNDPLPSDSLSFSRNRETSSIPKTGDNTNWIYPSAQQFYNAMRRRGKVDKEDEIEENTMDAVIFAHNVTNERTWEEILDWEKMHFKRCKDPSLLRFVGKSEDLSWKAQFSTWFRSRGRPFDRHDWTVDRCGLETVRYIIDYYDDPNSKENDELEITLDTRPALDSWSAVWDHVRKPFYGRWPTWLGGSRPPQTSEGGPSQRSDAG